MSKEVEAEDGSGTAKRVRHYLYFGRESDARRAVEELVRVVAFAVECRRAAMGDDWLVEVEHPVSSADAAFELDKARLSRVAKERGGEYDGWEVELADE